MKHSKLFPKFSSAFWKLLLQDSVIFHSISSTFFIDPLVVSRWSWRTCPQEPVWFSSPTTVMRSRKWRSWGKTGSWWLTPRTRCCWETCWPTSWARYRHDAVLMTPSDREPDRGQRSSQQTNVWCSQVWNSFSPLDLNSQHILLNFIKIDTKKQLKRHNYHIYLYELNLDT